MQKGGKALLYSVVVEIMYIGRNSSRKVKTSKPVSRGISVYFGTEVLSSLTPII